MAHLHGARMHGLVAMTALLASTCGSRPARSVPTPAGAAVGPRLIRDGERWSVTGLSADAADALEQGRLVAILRPIPDTPDQRPIAVFRTLGRPYGSTVDVALQCAIPGEQAEPGHTARLLASDTPVKVGPCLARIVGQGITDGGERYVQLDIGNAYLRPGDEYAILGTSVNAPGFVPLGLDTDHDGRCQIPADPTYLKINTARCMLVKAPRDRKELESGFAVFVAR